MSSSHLAGPAYLKLSPDVLHRRAEILAEKLVNCHLCPRACGVDRTAGEKGFCQIGRRAVIASFGPHFGEERPLVGTHGSGTVFFAGCNLGCVFCQNEDISHLVRGRPIENSALAEIFLEVQARNCHNLNLVTPTHVTPQILGALALAIPDGLSLPIVWNTGGYESPQILASLDGVVDIYMPDFKIWSEKAAQNLLQAGDYPEVARQSIREMHRQVGDLIPDEFGVAARGLLVRHLVLPHELADTADVAQFVAGLSPDTYFNLMDQYRPCHLAHQTPDIDRILTQSEFRDAQKMVAAAGLRRLADHDGNW